MSALPDYEDTGPEHGTYARWGQHKRDGEDPCPDCQLAATTYQWHWRHRHHWPVAIPPRYVNTQIDGCLGLAAARAVRESA